MFTVEGARQRVLRRSRLPKDPPVDEQNQLATQEVHLYKELNCTGESKSFTSSANAFMKDFQPYIHDLKSVKLCGKGSFFFFNSPEMRELSVLGHVTRCGPKITKSMDKCTCEDLPWAARPIVESISLEYC